jgi:hypothetical protein
MIWSTSSLLSSFATAIPVLRITPECCIFTMSAPAGIRGIVIRLSLLVAITPCICGY